MAKALFGTAATPSQLQLLDEIRALRQRVSELEAALDEARETARRAPTCRSSSRTRPPASAHEHSGRGV